MNINYRYLWRSYLCCKYTKIWVILIVYEVFYTSLFTRYLKKKKKQWIKHFYLSDCFVFECKWSMVGRAVQQALKRWIVAGAHIGKLDLMGKVGLVVQKVHVIQ